MGVKEWFLDNMHALDNRTQLKRLRDDVPRKNKVIEKSFVISTTLNVDRFSIIKKNLLQCIY